MSTPMDMDVVGATGRSPLPTPPPGYTWRALAPDDADAVMRLAAACTAQPYRSEADLAVHAKSLPADSLAALDTTGDLVACAWITFDDGFSHERRAFLDGLVHPNHRGRGLGRFLIVWMEERARQVWSAEPSGVISAGRPCVLRIDFLGHRESGAIALFEQLGYGFALAEEEMRRDLRQPLPDLVLPPGFRLEPWTPETAPVFYQVYVDAFSTRPGFPKWSEQTWRTAFATDPSFRPDLTMLLWRGDEPAGYALCDVEGEEGWIPQIGVRPAWRKQGLAAALLVEAMRRFRDAGLPVAVLNVNVNNPEAASVYQRLGFVVSSRYTSYRKTLLSS